MQKWTIMFLVLQNSFHRIMSEERNRSSKRTHILMDPRTEEDNGDSSYKTDASTVLLITDN